MRCPPGHEGNLIVASVVDSRRSPASPLASPANSRRSSTPSAPKTNPVALEVPVIATGARPGDSGGQRDLFTEETTTVLVFENGAVIRLSAAVAAGQLLFLTHKESRREVVAQVTRKRDFRPTNCYVEVKSRRGLAEFNFHVTIRGAEVALAGHLGDDFAPRFLMSEEKQLTGGHSRGKTDDRAVFEYQHRGGFFGKEVALAAAVAGARTGGDHWNFKSYRIGLWSRWRARPARICRARQRRGR